MKKTEFTYNDAAAELKVDRATISRHVAKLKLGRKLGARLMVLSGDDLERIKGALSTRAKPKKKKGRGKKHG